MYYVSHMLIWMFLFCFLFNCVKNQTAESELDLF